MTIKFYDLQFRHQHRGDQCAVGNLRLVCAVDYILVSSQDVFSRHSLKILRDIREKIIANFLGTVT